MEKAVPVFYNDVEVPGLLATITCDSLQQDMTINLMEVMRLTSFLRTNMPEFLGIQKTQILKNEDRVMLYSSA
jgi:hypothetical protein